MSREDIAATEKLFAILSRGRLDGVFSLAAKLHPKLGGGAGSWSRTSAPKDISLELAEAEPIHLLGCDVRLGKVRVVPVDARAFLDAYEQRLAEANRIGEPVAFELNALPVSYEYVEWLPDDLRWERLSELCARQEGYVALSQVRWIGYTDDVFLAFIPAGKIEPVATDVYHLTHFPHADREDLIVLWLQTDRRGVISHETALYLHGLCDILPAHLHITVPSGWTPRDRTLAADVEIRYGDVPETDLRWLGPVPYTGPLRTVRDCIEVGVSPELIEQAVAEGIRRGLFTEADFPQYARAESA
ncbi:MAG: hypothetical protein QM820_41495 [Minicystis sp.]